LFSSKSYLYNKFNTTLFIFYRLIKSNEVLAKSTIPPVGRVTRPRKPFPNPFIKPEAPPSFAPDTGLVTTPVTPSTKPFTIKKRFTNQMNNFKHTITTFFPPTAISVVALAPCSFRLTRDIL
jgi:hypothetical protein